MYSWILSLVLGRLADNKIVRYAVSVLLTVAVIAAVTYGIYTKGYWDGEAAKDAEYQIVIQEERERQIKARRIAEKKAAEAIARLQEVVDVRNAELERLRNEAAQDPNAGNTAIGPDSVRRLNRSD